MSIHIGQAKFENTSNPSIKAEFQHEFDDNTLQPVGNGFFSISGSGSMGHNWTLISSTEGAQWEQFQNWYPLIYNSGTVLCDDIASSLFSTYGLKVDRLSISADTIGYDAFNMSGSSSFYINYIDVSADNIGNNAFNGCKNTQFTFGYTPDTIGAGAFKNCQRLSSIPLDDNIELQSNTFENCYSLNNIGNGNDIYKINRNAMDTFKNCFSLTSFGFPDTSNVYDCVNLSSLFYWDLSSPDVPPVIPITSISTNIRKLADFTWSASCNRQTHVYSEIQYLLCVAHNGNWLFYEGYPNTIGWTSGDITSSAVVKHNNKWFYVPLIRANSPYSADEVYIARRQPVWDDYWLKLNNKETTINNVINTSTRQRLGYLIR